MSHHHEIHLRALAVARRYHSDAAELLDAVIELDQSKAIDYEGTLDVVLEDYLNRHDPVRKAQRYTQREAAKQVTRKMKKNSEANARNASQANDQSKRCENTRWIDSHSHHRKPVSRGGKDTIENIQTLCNAHHRKHHAHEHSYGKQPLRPSRKH